MVGDNVTYYAVDHMPSYLWNSATWANSEALLPSLSVVLVSTGGADSWVSRVSRHRTAGSSRLPFGYG